MLFSSNYLSKSNTSPQCHLLDIGVLLNLISLLENKHSFMSCLKFKYLQDNLEIVAEEERALDVTE